MLSVDILGRLAFITGQDYWQGSWKAGWYRRKERKEKEHYHGVVLLLNCYQITMSSTTAQLLHDSAYNILKLYDLNLLLFSMT